MGYIKHTWRSGETIKAEYLNNIENGILNEETRATNSEDILNNKINTNRSVAEDGIHTEEIRAAAAEEELSQRINDLNTAINDLHNYVDTAVSSTYRASGSVDFADLPDLSSDKVGNVYNVNDAFVTTADFLEGAGHSYPAGTSVTIVATDEDSYQPIELESTDVPYQMGLYEYDDGDYVLTQDDFPHEGKTYYFKGIIQRLYYDILGGTIDTSGFVKTTDIATNSRMGICKPDGNSIVVNDRGTFYINLRNPRDVTSIVDTLSLAVHHAELKRYGFDIGDWFDGLNYRYFIAGYNPFYGDRTGAYDTASSICLDVDHIALVFSCGEMKWHDSSESDIPVEKMRGNDSNTSVMDVGYAGSDYQAYLETEVLENVTVDMLNLLGGETGYEYLRSITKYYRGADDESSLTRYRHQYICALTERQVYGNTIYSKDPLQTGEAYNQLEIFRNRLPVASLTGGFWLRDIASETTACCVNDTGLPGTDSFDSVRNGAAMILFR